jgi:hypothetical protein
MSWASMMKYLLIRTSVLPAALHGARAYLVDPPTQALPDTIQDCSAWQVAKEGETCNYLAGSNLLSAWTFGQWVKLLTVGKGGMTDSIRTRPAKATRQ